MPAILSPGWGGRPLLGLIGYWPLDGTSANQNAAIDVSGAGNNGVGAGAAMASAVGRLPGRSAISLDGTANAYFQLPASLFPLGALPRTLAIWANAAIVTGTRAAIGYGTNTTSQFFALQRNTTSCQIVTNGAGDITATNVWRGVNHWAHIAATYDGTSNRLYVNGILRGTATDGSVNTVAGNTSIGSKQNPGSTTNWSGLLQDAHAYSRALTTSEILALYNWRPPIKRRSFYWPVLFVGSGSVDAAVATSETSDTAAVTATPITTAQVAAGESGDSAAAIGQSYTPSSIAAADTTDTAAIATEVTTAAQLVAQESGDAAALTALAITSAVIAIVESADRARINRVETPFFVPRRFGLVLYEMLPLRTTGALGNFAEQAVLPHRYGDLTSGRFTLIRLNDKTFFAADHPMTIADVFVDNQKATGWQQETRTDGDGNTWTVVVLAAPAPDGAALSATGTGKKNPRTGALIENPADIIEDMMRLAGRDDAWWDQLRAEAAAASLRLAGSVDEELSIREWIDRVAKSAGAIWAPGMARLYPVLDVAGYVLPLDKQKVSNLVVSASLDNTADVLRLYYDPDKAGGRSQHYIELTANPKQYDGIATDISFDWLRTPGNAESVGKRYLPWLAGERYDVAFDCSDASVRPGQWVKLVAHPQWPFADEPDPVVMIMAATVNRKERTVACTGQCLVTTPAALVTAHSVAIPTTRDAGLDVAVKDGITTIIARDPSDQPIAGARVNVDGGPAKTTDANGAVRFTLTAGQHRVAIQAPGKRAQLLTITT